MNIDPNDSNDQRQLLESAIQAISGDTFLVFIDKFIHSYVSPLSTKYLAWLATAPPTREEFNDADDSLSSLFLSSTDLVTSWTVQHHAAYEMYNRVFESRLQSALKQLRVNGKPVTPEDVYTVCETHLRSSPAEKSDKAVKSEGPTARDLCEAFLSMLEAASSFEDFATLLGQRQFEEFELLLHQDDDSDSDEGVCN